MLGVRTELERIYKHDGKGLKVINASSNLKLERDQVYKGVAGIRVFKKKLIYKLQNTLKTGHYILDQKSSHIINTDLDWKIANSI